MSEISQEDIDINNYEDTRKRLVSKLTEKGIPQDLEDRTLLLKAIDGGSKIALGRKKLKIEEKNGAEQAKITSIVAELLKNTPTAKQLLERNGGEQKERPVIDVVPVIKGEVDIGTKEIRYNEIMSSNEGQDHQ